MISQIARIQQEEAHRDDGYPLGVFVTPRSKEREERRRVRQLAQSPPTPRGGARGSFQEPLMFSRRWAATEIQRMWRGFVNSPQPFAYFGELSREYLARWRAAQLIQRVWRGYATRCALPTLVAPATPRLLDVDLYDRMPPTCESTCEKCHGSGYYTFADARGKRKVFMICHGCCGPWV